MKRKPIARKVSAATAGAALMTVLVWLLGLLVEVPAEVGDALVILGAFAGGYLRTEA